MRASRILVFVLLAATFAGAQATRTWVSGVGDDANPCSRTAPCKTFAGAISKTAAGGEIDALDPGGFGAVTITKSITIDGGGGQVASVLITGGTNAIVVLAGASDQVVLKNLRIQGALGNPSGAGLNGIRFLSGRSLVIDNCEIYGFSNAGVDIAKSDGGTAQIINTQIMGMTGAGGIGVHSQNTAANVSVAIDSTQIVGNTFGVAAQDFTTATISRSMVAGVGSAGNTGIQATAVGGGTAATVNVSDTTISKFGIGLQCGTSGQAATCNIASNRFFDNGANDALGGGTVHSGTGNVSNGLALTINGTALNNQ